MLTRIAGWLLNSPNILALDIGSKYMKVMQLAESGGLPTLHGAAIGSVPAGSVENGVITNKPAVASALRRMLDKNGIKGSRVFLAAGGPGLILRWIEMPAMPESDLREAIKLEAHKHLPIPTEQCALDFSILSRNGRQSEETLRILLTAAPRTLVDSRFETAELAGLRPIGMDIEPLAVLRALEHSHIHTEHAWDEHPHAVLLFGSSGTDFYVVKDFNLEFARRIPIGGSNFARVIAKGLNLDQIKTDEYELIRRAAFDQSGHLIIEAASDELVSELEAEMARLDQEILRSFSCFQSQFPEGSYEGVLTHVTTSGGLAAIVGLQAHLAGELGLTVDIADPLAKISIRNLPEGSDLLNGRRTSFIVSAGLFLGQMVK